MPTVRSVNKATARHIFESAAFYIFSNWKIEYFWAWLTLWRAFGRLLWMRTYSFCWNLNTNLLDGLGEFVWLDGAIVVQVEVLECLQENVLLRLCSSGLLSQLVFQFSLETVWRNVKILKYYLKRTNFWRESTWRHRGSTWQFLVSSNDLCSRLKERSCPTAYRTHLTTSALIFHDSFGYNQGKVEHSEVRLTRWRWPNGDLRDQSMTQPHTRNKIEKTKSIIWLLSTLRKCTDMANRSGRPRYLPLLKMLHVLWWFCDFSSEINTDDTWSFISLVDDYS